MLTVVLKSVGIFLASLLVIFLVMMFGGDPRRATGLGYLQSVGYVLLSGRAVFRSGSISENKPSIEIAS